MNTAAFLVELLDRGVRFRSEGGALRFLAPKGTLSAEVHRELRERKPEILDLVDEGRTFACVSFSQRRLWFIQQLDADDASYNMPGATFRLTGPLDIPLLESCLSRVVERHEALRTTIRTLQGQPAQVIGPAAPVVLDIADVSESAPDARAAAVQRSVREHVQRPFDLDAGPLFRARLIRLGTEEHVLALAMHHIVSDGWSIGVIASDLAALYDGASLLPPGMQYADYARWQRQHLDSGALAEQLDYWRGKLAGDLPVSDLPADHPRPAVRTPAGAQHAIHLSQVLADGLKALSRREGVTMFMTLLAAFKVLLFRHSGQDDVIVGAPVANRERPGSESAVGFFVNTLVLRTSLADDPSFSDVLQRVRETVLGAFSHQDLPFERLVEEFNPDRDLSLNPLFQVMFVYENLPAPVHTLARLTLERMKVDVGITKMDLNLHLEDTGDGLDGYLQYSTDLFEADSVARLAERFETLLGGIVAAPGQAIGALPVLAPRDATAGVPAQASEGAWREETIPARFEAQVRQYGDKVAIRTRDASWTYAELNAAADRIARALLQRRGVGEDRVALWCGEAVRVIAAMLGVLKAGKAYVPLDPAYPADRLAFMLEDSQATVLLTDADEPGFDTTGLDVIDLRTADGDADVPRVTPDSLAYVLYTSGSTGQPKGVMQTHRNVLHFIRAYANDLAIAPDDRLTLLSSFGFDAAVMDVYAALLDGATLYPISLRDEQWPDVRAWLADEGISVYHATPSAYRAFMAALPDDADFPDVRAVVLGGEEVREGDLRLFRRHFSKDCTFVNLFGASEASYYLRYIFRADEPLCRSAVPIGTPAEDMEVFLADAAGRPGQVFGEISVRCPYVALGYWGRPALTEAVFVADPARGGHRLYRSGDLARLLPDGTLAFLGRKDAQVKIRGYRVELGEIESALAAHPCVREAAAAVREDSPGDARLVAYVAGDALPSSDELRRYVAAKLPDYMRPNAFVALDALPRNVNGKIDRRALRAANAGGLAINAVDATFAAPQTPVEELLAGIWGELLGVRRVGLHDDFFALGGHSLLATQVLSRVQETLGVGLPLRAIFEAPTLYEQARRIEAARGDPLASQLPPLRPVPRTGRMPLSFAQQRLWVVDQLTPGSPAYTMLGGVRLRGRLDVDALRRSINAVVVRHESLRTTFGAEDGVPFQVISDALDVPVDVADVAERDIERIAREEIYQPFDLARGPLIRAHLLQIDADEHVLIVTIHHIVSDGWSMGVLIRELGVSYAASASGKEPPFAPLPIQYADFAQWQREGLRDEALDAPMAYWRERLAGLPTLRLPADRPRPHVQRFRGAVERAVLPVALRETLERVSRDANATLFMTLLAAFKVVLSRYARQEDIVVGTPVAGRNRVEIEGLIGFFVNMLVLRTDLGGDPAFTELVGRVRDTTLGAYDRQDVPFEKLVDAFLPERDLSRNPLFQVSFVLQNMPMAPLELPGMTVERLDVDTVTTRFDLEVRLRETSEGLDGVFLYNPDLFDAGTVAHMLAAYTTVLASAATKPSERISRLPWVSEEERRRLLDGSSEAQVPSRRSETLHALLEAQAERRPRAIAATCDGASLTYGELNARANRWARCLRDRGVTADVLVGLCVERSLDVVVGILAILKAGGAYLPLDLAYPEERLRFMLADSGTRLVLTQRSLRDRFDEAGVEALCLDDEDAAAGYEASDLGLGEAGDLAYVIYTSGSTGQPKGVLIEHRNVVRLFDTTDAWFRFDENDVWTLFHSYAFDFSVWEIWGALLYGGRLAVVPYYVGRSPEAFRDLLRREGVTVLNQTPSAFRQLIHVEDDLAVPAPLALRYVIFGGEALDLGSLRPWFERYGDERPRLINMYGITETTVHVTYRPLTKQDAADNRGSLVGVPLPDLQVYLLDERGGLVPMGAPGEIYVGGAGVGRGYLNRPELTAARFIPDPFSADPASRLYKSGDLARYRADGDLEYLGRMDTQVQLRGFRVELGEIEQALCRYDGVREAVVLAREDAPGDVRLVAYLVSPAPIPSSDLRAHLRRFLPDYMLPATYAFLDALPLTANGKLDRDRLLAAGGEQDKGLQPLVRETDRDDETTAYVAPQTPAQERIAEVFGEILGLAEVGIHDDFFELGGHSLLATRVTSHVRKAFGVDVPLRAFFEGPTVAALAEAVDMGRALDAAEEPAIAAFGASSVSIEDQLAVLEGGSGRTERRA